MFEKFSREQAARIAILVVTVFAFLGTDLDQDAVTTTVLTLVNIINAVGYEIRRRQGDVTPLGFRK